jgi:membrane-associated phospholipid phosphatase
VDELIVVVAQYLLFGLALVAALLWLTLGRSEKLRFAAEALLGLAVVGIGIWAAGSLHVDPRPFVHDPASVPLFAHPADNGFPSDHAAAGGLLTVLVLRWKRLLGLLVGLGAALIAVARVAAHVHHGQDVVAGLAIGLAGGAVAVLLAGLLTTAVARRRTVRGR